MLLSTLYTVALVAQMASADANAVWSELKRYELDVRQHARTLVLLQEQAAALQRSLAQARAQEAGVVLAANEASERFSKRLRWLVQLPSAARVLLLRSSSTWREYFEARQLLRAVARSDQKLRNHYLYTQAKATQLRTTLEEQEQQHHLLLEQLKTTQAKAAQAREAKQLWLKSLFKDANVRARILGTKSGAARALATLWRQLAPTPSSRDFSALRGKLAWPVTGSVVREFGKVNDRTYGTTTACEGLEIAALYGTPVHAVAEGTVAYADWLDGFGFVVIVSHGGNYHSLYGLLDELAVMAGTPVAAGATLGTVGDSGTFGESPSALYFEIRHKEVAVDPKPWLRGL